MRKFQIICALMISGASILLSQDILVLKNGDEIESKITEIGIDEIKYKKHSLPDGPDYVCLKSDVFMIKFENGSKEVFGNTSPAQTVETYSSGEGKATLYFFRPKKFSASRPEIIVGTSVPDEVILKLKNGRWHKIEYSHTGHRDFLIGIYAINPETFKVDISPGETYYFYCEPYEKGLTLMASMKLIDKAAAEIYMSELKEQEDSMVDR
jgi:hypothetical protein